MKQVSAFFRLIRFQNLFFIALTQWLFYFCIIIPTYTKNNLNCNIDIFTLNLIVLASVSIAAAGYIINDYFDLNIDRVNKPNKMVIETIIKRRWAMFWHFILSVIGVALTAIFSKNINNSLPIYFNIGAVLLLWFYSTSYKKQLLTGNIIISLLTSWVIGILYVAINPMELLNKGTTSFTILPTIFKFTVLYGGFSFIISMIREVVKDLEDRIGDEKYGCKTMPIVWGIHASKVFVVVWLIVLIAAISIVLIYALQLQWWWTILYGLVCSILPLCIVVKKLSKAEQPQDFHKVSSMVKYIMLGGIVSMLLIKWYLR